MFSTFSFTYEQLTRCTEAEIRAWMARADQNTLLKRERAQARDRAIGALQLWLTLTQSLSHGAHSAVRAAHAIDAARLSEWVGLPEQAGRAILAPHGADRVAIVRPPSAVRARTGRPPNA
ncbi:hypothetical protein DP59_3083 [Burkholderia pseudomallei]|nr:hypothetical protein DP59_3083 [Burkholderia pseudomallei]